MTPAADRLRDLSPQWLALLLIIRAATAASGIVLLAVHHVTAHDQALMIAAAAYGTISIAAVRWRPQLVLMRAFWAVDLFAVLTLVAFSSDWRSPFYLFALTALATPAAALRPARAVALGAAFSAAYFVLARFIGPDPLALGAQTTIETLATHLLLPLLVAFGVSYAADTVRRLRAERRRAERLAIEAERRRIAWELHDSAKQRVHAAHLVLDSIPAPADGKAARAMRQVLAELRAAASDMDTSVAELRSPLEGRPLHVALRERAADLGVGNGPAITVAGALDGLGPLQAAHAYRIAAEALTNAVRHAHARRIDVTLGARDGEALVVVADDGAGMPADVRPGANGLRAMRNRAASLGGSVSFSPAAPGTRVELRFPINGQPQEIA